MDWMETVVHTTTMGADLVSDVLMGAGAVGTSIEDRFDVTSSKKSDGMWDMIDEDVLRHMSDDVLVKAYFEQGPSAQEALHLLRQKLQELSREEMGFDIGSLELEIRQVCLCPGAAIGHTVIILQHTQASIRKPCKPMILPIGESRRIGIPRQCTRHGVPL